MNGYTLPKMTSRITKSAKSCESKITMRQAVGTTTWQAGKPDILAEPAVQLADRRKKAQFGLR
jgi:hypothetical protein